MLTVPKNVVTVYTGGNVLPDRNGDSSTWDGVGTRDCCTWNEAHHSEGDEEHRGQTLVCQRVQHRAQHGGLARKPPCNVAIDLQLEMHSVTRIMSLSAVASHIPVSPGLGMRLVWE